MKTRASLAMLLPLLFAACADEVPKVDTRAAPQDLSSEVPWLPGVWESSDTGERLSLDFSPRRVAIELNRGCLIKYESDTFSILSSVIDGDYRVEVTIKQVTLLDSEHNTLDCSNQVANEAREAASGNLIRSYSIHRADEETITFAGTDRLRKI